MKPMRLDKFLADCGCGTRTEVKKYIRAGDVTINNDVIKDSSVKIEPEYDEICWRGKKLSYSAYQYIMLYKPTGCVTATKDNCHKTVMDYLPADRHKDLSPVGRLDLDTEGLLLITDDGETAHNLLAPGRHVEKTYFARIEGYVTQKECALFAEGLDIGEDKLTKPAVLEIVAADSLSEVMITVTEGRFHQIKRMFQAVGMKVLYLKRISMGPLVLDETLKPGQCRFLTENEISKLKDITEKILRKQK